jgi:hypothetical protein
VKTILIVVSSLAVLLVLVYIGLQIKPAPYAAFAGPRGTLETVPLPAGLPAPVERFYRKIYGEQIPVIRSAVISGRATIRPVGPVSLPARFRFTHLAGKDYRHDIEATIFGIPMLKVIETYISSSSRQQMPWGTTQNDPKANQGANLAVWAEAIWFPAILVTDPRVRWQAVDDVTAILTVPFQAQFESFVVRFDPATQLVRYLESMRFKTDAKILWVNETRSWGKLGGQMVPTQGAVTWMNDGKPWAVFNVEEIVLNADVSVNMVGTGK